MKIDLPTRTDTAAPAQENQVTLPFFLALLLMGMAGNILHFHVFFDIDLLFGSIFALLALQAFGLWRGVVAAALISSYTIIDWNHPYACLILTAEVAVVGWLSPRRKIGLVLADTLFWLCLGMPLVYLFYHGVMGVSWESTSIVMTKQALNGIANALIARLLFAKYAMLSRSRFLPFREMVSVLLGFFVLIPSLAFLAISSRADFAKKDQDVRSTLAHDSEIMCESLEIWLENRKAPIVTLARLAETFSPQEMQARLEQALASDPNFLRIGLLDQTATSIAFAPLLDNLGRPATGLNYADRPFIPLLQKNLQPLLSEVVIARIGPPKPVVQMLVPVVKNSQYAGYISGTLKLDHIDNALDMNATRDGQRYILLDRHGNVIASNDEAQQSHSPRVRGEGMILPRGEGVAQWVPPLPAKRPTSERWNNSYYFAEQPVGESSEWRLILEQPVASFQKQLYDTYTRKLDLLFLILLGALFLSEILSRNLSRSNEELQSLTADLPSKLAADTPVAWPESAIYETQQLIENFRGMAVALTAQFSAIRKINASLKERVEVRTLELLESRERYDLALLGSQDGIWDWNLLSDEAFFSVHYCEMLGYAANELNPSYATFEDLVHPADREAVRKQIQLHLELRIPYSVEFRMRRKDGEYSWILARGQALWNEEGEPVRMAGSHTDISERKKTETEMLSALREKEVLLKEIHHRVKNNLQIVYSLLTLQANGIADSKIRVLFDESRDRIGSMALIHEKLYNSSDISLINFRQYLQELAQNIAGTYQRQEIVIVVDGEPIFLDINSGIPCGLIVNELVSNSFKHAFPQGRSGQITIGLTRSDAEHYLLTVADNGSSLPPHIDIRNTTSLGMQLVLVLTEQLQGRLELETDAGTRFAITFPGAIRS